MSVQVASEVRAGMLYDFYGELLTEHRKSIFEDFMFNDLSLGEIAEDTGTSRQAVHDTIKKTTATLEEYEAKLHLLEKFLDMKSKVSKIKQIASVHEDDADMKKIVGLAEEMLD